MDELNETIAYKRSNKITTKLASLFLFKKTKQKKTKNKIRLRARSRIDGITNGKQLDLSIPL